MRPAALFLLLPLLLAIAASGCGGSQGSGGLGPEAWAERADEICSTAQEELHAVEPPGELSEVPAYVEQTLPIAERELRQLRALEPEEEIRPEVDRFLAEVENALAGAEGLAAAAEAGDVDAARAAGREAQTAAREVARLARGLGAHACAEQ